VEQEGRMGGTEKWRAEWKELEEGEEIQRRREGRKESK